MLLFGCVIAFGAAVAPRLVLILAWLFGRRWDLVWRDNFILPLLGIIFAPYTTIMYLLTWSPTGLQGFDWAWIALGVLLDIMKWSQIVRNKEGIPSLDTQKPPPPRTETAATPTSAPAATPSSSVSDTEEELKRLAALHEEGVLTDEEFEAKKKQLLDI